jgi:hypothetical protein
VHQPGPALLKRNRQADPAQNGVVSFGRVDARRAMHLRSVATGAACGAFLITSWAVILAASNQAGTASCVGVGQCLMAGRVGWPKNITHVFSDTSGRHS